MLLPGNRVSFHKSIKIVMNATMLS